MYALEININFSTTRQIWLQRISTTHSVLNYLLINKECDRYHKSGNWTSFRCIGTLRNNHIIIVCICFVENKIYKDRGAGIKFAKLINYLAKHFPHQKLDNLKLILLGKFLFTLILCVLYMHILLQFENDALIFLSR